MEKKPQAKSKFLVLLIERGVGVVDKSYVIVEAFDKDEAAANALLSEFVAIWRDPRAESVSVLDVWNVAAEGPMNEERILTFLREHGCDFFA